MRYFLETIYCTKAINIKKWYQYFCLKSLNVIFQLIIMMWNSLNVASETQPFHYHECPKQNKTLSKQVIRIKGKISIRGLLVQLIPNSPK